MSLRLATLDGIERPISPTERRIAMDTITVKQLQEIYEVAFTEHLLPKDLAQDFADFDRRYRDLLGDEGWKQKRRTLRPLVDNLIEDVLMYSKPEHAAERLRRIPNEILIYYFDRLLCVRFSLEFLSRSSEASIPLPASWTDFWLDYLVNRACEGF